MGNMVRPQEEVFGKEHGLVHEAIVTGRKVGAGRFFWKGLAHDEQFFQEVMLVARRFGYGGFFISAAEQLELVRKRSAERNWGFTDQDFASLGEPPAWPEGDLCAVVLEVCLDTVQQTFEEAWLWASEVQPNHWRWEKLLSDEESLRLLSGIQHQRGLRWRVVDLAANWDKKDGIRPMDVRNPKKSPHCAILWAAALFPAWVQAMDGTKVPYAWMAGYELSVSGSQSWSDVPYLCFNRGSREVKLNAAYGGSRSAYWAVPEFRE